MESKFFKSTWPPVAFIVCLSFGIYLNASGGDFISDDRFQILRNEWIRDPSYLLRILFSSVWDFLPGEGDSNYYRPVKYIIYTLTYAVSALDPRGYHLMKILCHALASVLVFLVTRDMLRDRSRAAMGGGSALNGEPGEVSGARTGFIAAIFFAAHTINTESVNWIAALPEVSFTLFSLLSFFFFIRERYMAAAAAFLVSALSKETAMALPILFAAYDLLVRREPLWRVLPYLKRYLLLIAAAAVYFVMRVYALGGELLALGGGEATHFLTKYEYIINVPLIAAKYVRKLVLPTDISFFNYMNFDPVYSITEPRAVLFAALFILSVAVMLALIRRAPVLLFSLLWVVIFLLPVFFLGWKTGSPVYESRYLYASTAGYGVFLALLFTGVFEARWLPERSRVRLLLAAALVVTSLYSAGTVIHNRVWISEYALWQDSARKKPESRGARISYGIELAKLDRLDEALGEFEAARGIDPESSAVYNNIGIIYAKRGLFSKAAGYFEKAVIFDPKNIEARRNLAQARELLGIPAGAVKEEGK